MSLCRILRIPNPKNSRYDLQLSTIGHISGTYNLPSYAIKKDGNNNLALKFA